MERSYLSDVNSQVSGEGFSYLVSYVCIWEK